MTLNETNTDSSKRREETLTDKPSHSRQKLLAQVHTARKHWRFSEKAYRNWLHRKTGKRSCTLLTDAELEALVRDLRPTHRQWTTLGKLVRRRGWSGFEDERFAAFVKRTTQLDNPRLLDRPQASQVILGLQRWLAGKGAGSAGNGA
jgi:uncharacterized protein (DUF2252 family)